jgi:hypothetical protein
MKPFKRSTSPWDTTSNVCIERDFEDAQKALEKMTLEDFPGENVSDFATSD